MDKQMATAFEAFRLETINRIILTDGRGNYAEDPAWERDRKHILDAFKSGYDAGYSAANECAEPAITHTPPDEIEERNARANEHVAYCADNALSCNVHSFKEGFDAGRAFALSEQSRDDRLAEAEAVIDHYADSKTWLTGSLAREYRRKYSPMGG